MPPRILEGFAHVPEELVDLCRPHPWADLTRQPAEGMRPIRDILVHLIGAERYWLRYVVQGAPRERLAPDAFPDLDAVLAAWQPQRQATLAFVQGLSAEEQASRRPFPWNKEETASVAEIVWHVVTHEQYHRGQVFTRLALLGRRDLPDYDLLR